MQKFITMMIILLLSIQITCSSNPETLCEPKKTVYIQPSTFTSAFNTMQTAWNHHLTQKTLKTATLILNEGSFIAFNALQKKLQVSQQYFYPHQHEDTLETVLSTDNSDSESSDNEDEGDYQIIKENKKHLNCFTNQAELQKQLKEKPEDVIHQLHEHLKSYYNSCNPETDSVQANIAHILQLVKESNSTETTLPLAGIIANKYNPQQLKILEATIEKHANTIMPKIEQLYDQKIQQATIKRNLKIAAAHARFNKIKTNADQEKEKAILESLRTVKLQSENSAILNSYADAQAQQNHTAHELNHFSTTEDYLKFITAATKKT